jgi:hypothetical protein
MVASFHDRPTAIPECFARRFVPSSGCPWKKVHPLPAIADFEGWKDGNHRGGPEYVGRAPREQAAVMDIYFSWRRLVLNPQRRRRRNATPWLAAAAAAERME